MHVSECASEFENATGSSLEELFVNAEQELPEFFKLKSDVFRMSMDGQLSLVAQIPQPVMTQPKKAARANKTNGGKKSEEIVILD